MIKHSYIILPPLEIGGRQTIVSLTIHGEAPSPHALARQAVKGKSKRGGGQKVSS